MLGVSVCVGVFGTLSCGFGKVSVCVCLCISVFVCVCVCVWDSLEWV
jgi:hypothetical protein